MPRLLWREFFTHNIICTCAKIVKRAVDPSAGLCYTFLMRVKITAMRRSEYPDLMARYENPMEHPCDIEVGQVFISENGEKPEGLCDGAWESMARFVKELAAGGGNFYGDWMKNPHSAMISCNDGFRPMSFYLEVIK